MTLGTKRPDDKLMSDTAYSQCLDHQQTGAQARLDRRVRKHDALLVVTHGVAIVAVAREQGVFRERREVRHVRRDQQFERFALLGELVDHREHARQRSAALARACRPADAATLRRRRRNASDRSAPNGRTLPSSSVHASRRTLAVKCEYVLPLVVCNSTALMRASPSHSNIARENGSPVCGSNANCSNADARIAVCMSICQRAPASRRRAKKRVRPAPAPRRAALHGCAAPADDGR